MSKDEHLRRLGERVRAQRQRLGYSLEELAKISTVPKQTLGRIELGTHEVGWLTVAKIARGLGLPLDTLVTNVPALQDPDVLSRTERALLEQIRSLDPDGRHGLHSKLRTVVPLLASAPSLPRPANTRRHPGSKLAA